MSNPSRFLRNLHPRVVPLLPDYSVRRWTDQTQLYRHILASDTVVKWSGESPIKLICPYHKQNPIQATVRNGHCLISRIGVSDGSRFPNPRIVCVDSLATVRSVPIYRCQSLGQWSDFTFWSSPKNSDISIVVSQSHYQVDGGDVWRFGQDGGFISEQYLNHINRAAFTTKNSTPGKIPIVIILHSFYK